MKIILIEIIFIFILFIRELGLPKLLYEELYTNPIARKMIPVFGDILYMVGGSIIASVVFAYILPPSIFSVSALMVGILFASIGAYLRK
ncbi:hypothetical protein ACNSOL_12315 (plasmid) [Aliarcobacter lanthieri]|uniref:hypothetical protein n=1 Tax=Aliarcobacter lanthieri TaxID=1355374 RepID=UPI003AAB4016